MRLVGRESCTPAFSADGSRTSCLQVKILVYEGGTTAITMSAGAPERFHLQQLWADETLGDSAGGSSSTAAEVAQTAFPDPMMSSDKRVLRRMLEREEKELTAVVSLSGYESQTTDVRLFMRPMVVGWMHEVCVRCHISDVT